MPTSCGWGFRVGAPWFGFDHGFQSNVCNRWSVGHVHQRGKCSSTRWVAASRHLSKASRRGRYCRAIATRQLVRVDLVVGILGGRAHVDLDPVDLAGERVGRRVVVGDEGTVLVPTSQVSSAEKIIAAVAATLPSPILTPSR